MTDPCCRHCGHRPDYTHPVGSHCARCFPTDEDSANFALLQAACATAGVELPAEAVS